MITRVVSRVGASWNAVPTLAPATGLPAASTTDPVTSSAATVRELAPTETSELRSITPMTRSDPTSIRRLPSGFDTVESHVTKMRERVVWSQGGRRLGGYYALMEYGAITSRRPPAR